MPTLGHLIK